jgi:hypothetical protein
MRFGRDTNKVVIGLVTNYDFGKIAPFLNSLAATAYQGCVVLYVNNISRETLRSIQAYGVETRPAAAFLKRNMDQQLTRYLMYFDFLSEYPNALNFVMFSDVRDVIFQADPSGITQSETPGFHVFLESAHVPIDWDGSNLRWLYDAYGQDVAGVIGAMPICCSGITIGDHAGMLAYTGMMIDEMRQQSGSMRIRGVDQGIHNFILWMRRPALAVIHQNGDHVLTLGVSTKASYSVAGDVVSAEAGQIPPIVHQWDRHPELVNLVERKFGGKPSHASAITDEKVNQIVVGHVSVDGTREGVAAFLVSLRQAGFAGKIMLGASQDLPFDVSDLALRFNAALTALPPTRGGTGFHRDLADLLRPLPKTAKVVCLDAGSTIFLNSPFRTRFSPLMCVAYGQRQRLGKFPKIMEALAKFAVSHDISGKFLPYPRFFMGNAADVLRAIEGINDILESEAGWAGHMALEIAAVSHVIYRTFKPIAEVLPNFSFVANLSGLDDNVVSLDTSALFLDRYCSVVLESNRSIKFGAFIRGMIGKEMGV